MYIVSYKSMVRNAVNYSFAMQKSASSLNDVLGYIPFFKENNSKKYHVFEVSNEDCGFECTIIFGKNEIFVVLQSMGTRVYDYSCSDEAIEDIKIMASLMGCYSFEEDE